MFKYLIIFLLLVSCGAEPETSNLLDSRGFIHWKSVLMTGDDSINAFDNARKKVAEILTQEGVLPILQLSRASSQQTNGVRASSVENFRQAFVDHALEDWDGCFAFITSHGSRSEFYMRGQTGLNPSTYNSILDATCGTRPTVLLVSACYSGIFSAPLMQKPNRIILTAASKDRTSFGCDAGATYTYWDSCLVESLATPVKTWKDLYTALKACIEPKEQAMGYTPSQPQGFFGADIENYPIFDRF